MTDQQSYKSTPSTRSSVLEKARKYNIHPPKQEAPQPEVEQDMGGGGGVTPELLVDALSGHEDGLLAIAERLMEHYDKGYDVMGEAIIDAFADVQKLFQHVVEAAHMEGAAFEASRREQEDANKRRNQGDEDLYPLSPADSPSKEAMQASPGGQRHDEFIDDDVRQVLAHAIREGQALRDASKHMECYEKYEQACQGASALLPVDSDHRGRLQLSIARAESMTAERACAILRYAMDDVLRSGQRAHSMPMPDPSKRADVVLQRPKEHPSLGAPATPGVVLQSADEALASLMEEMKEVLSAPLYQDTPVQDVARRFWETLEEMQKTQEKDLQMLEQKLANLKGDFLLARAVRTHMCSAHVPPSGWYISIRNLCFLTLTPFVSYLV